MENKNRIFCICNSTISIAFGVLIYALTRTDTPLQSLIDISLPQEIRSNEIVRFVSFYIADALWAYSLFFALSLFNSYKTAAIISFSFGIVWELLQHFSVVKGTFDYIDVFMYLIANLFAIIIFKISGGTNEKNSY